MRRRSVCATIATALLFVSCGSDGGVTLPTDSPAASDTIDVVGSTGDSEPTSTTPAADPFWTAERMASVEELVTASTRLGPEIDAVRAVLLSGDLGYTPQQVVDALLSGALQPDGTITSVDGTPVLPIGRASGLFEGGDEPMATVLKHVAKATYRGLAVFSNIVAATVAGYSAEQITEGILTGTLPEEPYFNRGPAFPIDDDVAPSPEYPPLPLFDTGTPDTSATAPNTSAPASTVAPVSTPADPLLDLVARATGTYLLDTESIRAFLADQTWAVDASIEGEATIAADGTIVAWGALVDEFASPEGSSTTSATWTIETSSLTVLDDGLTFTAEVVTEVVRTCERADGDACAWDDGTQTSPPVAGTGYVDVDLGVISIEWTPSESSPPTFVFSR